MLFFLTKQNLQPERSMRVTIPKLNSLLVIVMKLFTSRPGQTLLLLPILGLPLLSSCVKQSDYDMLANEKAELESQLGKQSAELQQANTQAQAQRARLLQLMNVEGTLQKRDAELQQTREELEAIRAEYEKFRTQRRNAMLGKKMPYFHLDSGKMLKDVEVVAIDPNSVSFRHEGGLIKVAMSDTNEDFRWEVCFDKSQAEQQERARFLSDARRLDIALTEARRKPVVHKTEPTNNSRLISGAQQLRNLITAQRAELNRAYEALRASNPTLKGDSWNSGTPESSPLINSFDHRRAVMGLNRLEVLRDTINDNLARLRAAEAH